MSKGCWLLQRMLTRNPSGVWFSFITIQSRWSFDENDFLFYSPFFSPSKKNEKSAQSVTRIACMNAIWIIVVQKDLNFFQFHNGLNFKIIQIQIQWPQPCWKWTSSLTTCKALNFVENLSGCANWNNNHFLCWLCALLFGWVVTYVGKRDANFVWWEYVQNQWTLTNSLASMMKPTLSRPARLTWNSFKPKKCFFFGYEEKLS